MWNGACPGVVIVEINLKKQKPVKGLCFRFKGVVITFLHLNNLISYLNRF